jgi:hypothetical protein
MYNLYETPNYTAYTIEDKILVYKKLLKRFLADQKIGDYFGLCYYMIKVQSDRRGMESVKINRKDFHCYHSLDESPFPELLLFKPNKLVNSEGKPGGVYWYALDLEGSNERLKILENILKQLSSNV